MPRYKQRKEHVTLLACVKWKLQVEVNCSWKILKKQGHLNIFTNLKNFGSNKNL